jgi:phosphatidylinositol phospholipase C, delta
MATERMPDNVSFEAVSTMAEMEEINMLAEEAKDSSPDDNARAAAALKAARSGDSNIKTPATLVVQALQNLGTTDPLSVACFDRLHYGIKAIKVTSTGGYKKRYLTISHDRCALLVTHEPIFKYVGKESIDGGSAVKDNKPAAMKLPLFSHLGIRGVTVSHEELRNRFVRFIDVADMDGIQLGLVGTQHLEAARGTSGATKYLKTGSSMTPIDVKVDQIVTILHHGDDSLDVLIPEARDRHELVACLRLMRQTYHAVRKYVNPEAQLLRYIWYDVDLNRDGLIGCKEFAKILARINFHIKRPEKTFRVHARELYDKKGGSKVEGNIKDALTYVEVMNLLQRLKKKHAADPSGKGVGGVTMTDKIWNHIFGQDKNVIGVNEFLQKFLHGPQGMKHLTLRDAQEIFQTINSMQMNHTEGEPMSPKEDGSPTARVDPQSQLTRPRFELFLLDAMNSAYDPLSRKADLMGPLVQPISQYWINTSHNTYLTGDQLTSASSVEMYLRALRRGCKCLELDCWDGETSKMGRAIPVIYHGHTLTSKILFCDVVKAVKSYMVSNPSTYPVILSLESHCSHPFQLAMARILTETLGELLYIPADYEREGNLPSPEFLRGKVVIKGKRPPEPDLDETDTAGNDQDVDDNDPYDVLEGTAAGSSKMQSANSSAASIKKGKVIAELARLTLFHGTSLKSFEKSMTEPNSHMHSIGETKIPTIIRKSGPSCRLWRQYNIHHMTRTYPAGKRVDSSNYNPLLAWSVGCQLVALNFQTPDTPLILNDGRFRENNGCGYVLKPKSVMEDAAMEPPNNKEPPPSPTDRKQTKQSIEKFESKGEAARSKDSLDHVMEGFESAVCGAPADVAAIESVEEDQAAYKLAKLAAAPKLSERMSSYREFVTNRVKTMRLRIRILGGSCLPKPRGSKTGETIDPYVTVTLHDVKCASTSKAAYVTATFSTPAVNDNGFCPVWGDRTLKELTVESPEVALLQFSLNEQDVGLDDRVAEAAIPCNRLRKGYRSIQLYDKNSTRTGAFGFATLLVEIQAVLDSSTL